MEHCVHAAVIGDGLRSGAAPEVLARPRGRTAHRVLTAGTPGRLSAPHALVTLPSAAGSAWRFLRALLRHCQLGELAGTADLAGSEPLTHALTAAGVPAPASCARLYGAALGNIAVRLHTAGHAVITEVCEFTWCPITSGPPVSGRTKPGHEERRADAAATGGRR